MSLIFLSHSSADEVEAVALKQWLWDHGWDDVFLDLDPRRSLKGNERWQEALRRAADRCDPIIFVISPSWAKSKWSLSEFLLARTLHKFILGVVVKETDLRELPVDLIAECQLCQLVGKGPTEPYASSISKILPRSDSLPPNSIGCGWDCSMPAPILDGWQS